MQDINTTIKCRNVRETRTMWNDDEQRLRVNTVEPLSQSLKTHKRNNVNCMYLLDVFDNEFKRRPGGQIAADSSEVSAQR